ncbi:MAG: FAD-dependent oxidoreductase [Myxococcota bacterium]|nr:FAD-dependent oxidoreductase [Myxococcota bacterium]
MLRLRPPRDPVALLFDGETTIADRGEPLAAALVAAGHLTLARSPKFHRPRGPSCFRAACDGCLARVDDEPNVMTCRVPAAEGMRVETQNVAGTRELDVLRLADWFFPAGMNHHELFAGVPGLQGVLQSLARRVAGLGRLPQELRPPREPPSRAERRAVDVLVVGAGAAGMSIALQLSKRGRAVEVLDEDLCWGGSARALAVGFELGPWQRLIDEFAHATSAGCLSVRLRTTAAGIYGDDVLVACRTGVEVVNARTLVLAPGAHDGVLAFQGNDVPGVMSARAGALLASYGVAPGRRLVVAVDGGGGPFAAAVMRAFPSAVRVEGVPLRCVGNSRAKGVVLGRAQAEHRLACDVLLVEAPGAPAYELCAQAGAELAHEARGFVVRAPGGKIRDGVFAVGEVVGTPLEVDAIAREARLAAERA